MLARLRIWLPDVPGVLGAVAAEIGAVGGNVIGLEVLEREAGVAIDELVVELPDDAGAVDALCRGVRNVSGVGVEEVTAVAGAAPDREDTVLDAATGILHAATPAEVMTALTGRLVELFGLSWLAVADSGLTRFVEVRGEAPTVQWVAAFTEGSRSGADPANDTTGSGVFVEVVHGMGLTVCGGRGGGHPATGAPRDRHAGHRGVTLRGRPGWERAHRLTAASGPPIVPEMVRIGFVGSGLIAWCHGLGLKAMIDGGVIDASIVSVYDQHERRAQGFADAVGVDGATLAADAAGVAAASDVVWVCTPTSAHRQGVEAALQAGRPVFCEKPLDRDLTGAVGLADAVAASGLPSQCGLVLRSAPVFRALRDLVQGGTLGAPMTAIFRDDQFFPIRGHYASQWRSDVEQAGGGCLIEHSIHDVDILRYVFGEVREVSARTANFAGHQGIEDLAAVSMSFVSGLEAQLTSVWHDIMTRGSTRRIEVFCREGMVSLTNEFRGPLRVQTSDGTELRACPSPPWVDELPLADDETGLALRAYVEADRDFVDAVVGGRSPEPSLTEAVQAHLLVDAAYRSAADGGVPVALP